MAAVQSPPSLSSFPSLTAPLISPNLTPRKSDMPSTTAKNPPQNTSVFNALGSYADRIKDANGKIIAAPTNGTSPQPPLSSLPGSSSSNMTTPPIKAAPAASSTKSVSACSTAKPDSKKGASAPREEEEVWETVQHPRQRQKNADESHSNHKEKKSQANASRNWRERPAKDSKDSKDKDDDEKKRSGSKSSRKAEAGSSSSGPKPSTSATSVGKTERVLSTSSSKPAWGKVSPTPPATSTPSTATSTSISNSTAGPSTSDPSQTPKTAGRKASPAETSTPSANGSSGPASAASPALTAETASSVTVATSETTKVADNEEEGSWRAKPKENTAQQEETVTPPAAPSTRPTAPPPSVNAWDLRKKTFTASPAASTPSSLQPKPGQSATAQQFGTLPPASNSAAKTPNVVEGVHDDAPKPSSSVPSKKKKKATAATEGPVIVPDSSAWPDIAQAVQVAKKDDDEKERMVQRKKGSENGSVLDEAAVTSAKKTKWKSIPAAELQAAVDRQAEQDRKNEAAKKRVNRPGPAQNAPVPPKTKAKKASVDSRKAPATPHVPHPLPPQPNGDHVRAPAAPPNAQAAPFKPASALANTRLDGESVASQATDSVVPPTTSSSTPMSRQASTQSGDSPELIASPHSPARSAVADGSPLHAVSSRPMSASVTAPLGQSSFAQTNGAAGAHGLPRIPGKRDGRGSFSHRGGRGGFRGMKGGITSPVMGPNGLPVDGFGRGYGYGFQGMNGMGLQYAQGSPQAQGQTAGVYDPTAVQWQMYQRGAAPPPPMPQTPIQGLDVQRFYVLGQVEYYFSMQNLAMDFFLRQQMDSEGWIDISMIASFNRLKSLTPDVAMVKEVMELSSLLEVRDEKVRLSAADFRRWILPDAKASIFPPDPASSSTASPAIESLSQSQEDSEISDVLETLGIPAGLGLEDMNGGASKMVPGGVEGALMKSVPPSSSVSVLNGDGDVTPATSMSGRDGEEEAPVADVQVTKKVGKDGEDDKVGSIGNKAESATGSEGVQVELR